MADLERLKRALVNADRAGDIVAAQAFARQIRQQISAPSAKQSDPAMNPTSDMNTFERFAAGAGKSITDAGRGLGQMVGLVDQKDIEESRRLDAPLMNTGAGTAGNIAGNVALLAPTAAIPGANTVTGATLINALAGAALTPGTLGERAQAASFSGLGGGAGIGAGKVISGAGRIANAAAMPLTKSGQEKIVGEVLRRAAGNNADDVISRLRGATELVPGSAPTAAEVADSGGIAALQRAMSAANPDAYAHRGMSNNAARVEALRGIAGDEQAMQAAIAARKSATDPLYRAADSAVVTSDDQLREIMSRLPNGTIAQAQEIARMTNRPIKFGRDIPESSVATGRVDLATGLPVMQTTAAQNAEYTGRGIDIIKKAIDDVVNTNPTAAIGKNAKSAGLGVKQDLVNWADNAIPEYGQARQAWAEGTVPISQMQIGQELLNKLEPSLVSYHPSGAQFRQAGSSFANALNDVRGNLVKNATGGIKRNLEDVMSPEQMATLNGIGADLSRSAAAADMGRGAGSNTFQNFAMDNLAAQSGMPPSVGALGNILTLGAGSKLMGGAKLIANKIYQGSDDAMKSRMADILLDPQAAASVMENSAKPGRIGQALQNAIGQGGVDKLNYGISVAPGVLGSAFALPYGSQ